VAEKKLIGIKKTDTLGSVIESYPEIAPVLAQAGLHCIGCHVSAYESIEEGCRAHGMSKKDVDDLVKNANKRIGEYEKLPKVTFTEKSVFELDKRLSKPKKKFARLVQVFGEFDFEAMDKKEKEDIVIEASAGKKSVNILAAPKVERMLRGVRIDFDAKQNDFVAARE
jgi:hybrid cluster-associated redox disulfide protein